MATNPTYNSGWTVQSYLDSMSTTNNAGQKIWVDPTSGGTKFTTDPAVAIKYPAPLGDGKTMEEVMSERFGITDVLNNLNAPIPDVRNSSGDAGEMFDNLVMTAVGAGVGGGIASWAGGLGAATGGVGGQTAGALGSAGGDAGMFGGLADLEAAYPTMYGQAAGEAAAAGAPGAGWSLGDLSKIPTGMPGGGDTINVSDPGDETAWTSQGFQPTMVDDAGGGGLGGFFGSITPGQWLGFGGTLLGAGAGLLASSNASQAQQKAAADAQGLQYAMYQQNRQDLMPWRNAGMGALNTLQGQMPEFTRRFGMSDFNADPGYQFRLAEGEKAINRAAQARGLFNSGGTMKALDRFNQNTAADEYNRSYNRFTQDQSNAYNKLSNLAGMGQTTAQQIAGDASSYANRAGEYGLQGANAYASGQIGGANTLANALNQGISSYNQQNMLSSLFPQTPTIRYV